jgi:DNA-binding transcriptional ArsR family regulator
MNAAQQRELLNMLKAIADKQRLTMVSLMGDQERTVSEMSALLDLTEPTISYHVARLHEAGLLRLRMAGTQRFYQINRKRLDQLKAYVDEIDQPVEASARETSDNAWIEALDWSEADKKVLKDYTANGRLKQIPAKDKKWLVIVRWLATKFEPGVRYTEKQVNAILTEIYDDYATMRRDLVGYGFMQREPAGGDYWLTPADEVMPADPRYSYR